MSAVTLKDIAVWVAGRVVGDDSLPIHDALPLQDASPNCITLVDNAKYTDKLATSPASAAVVPNDFPVGSKTLLVVDKPHAAFETIVNKLRPQTVSQFTGIHPAAYVDLTARIGAGTTIQPGAYIAENVTLGQRCTIYSGVNIMAGCTVGDDCTLYPNVTLYQATILGDRVLIHAGATLGAFGFGYRMVQGRHERTAQLGWVQVDSDVEIGAGTTIDRGTFGATRIGEGTKIDNQVQIGHNCHIGKHNLLCSQVGIAGSCTTGDYVVMAGQVGMKDHINISDKVIIGAQAGVMQDIEPGQVMLGSPAMPHKQTMQQIAALTRLPEMRRQLRDLQQQVAALAQVVAEASASVPKSDSHETRKAA
jgi:UDP-3-O-[3-hydroxymyristoyl] glucosamine N-acyltransferase